MRVLHVLNELRLSGAEFLLTSGAHHLIKDGDTHVVISLGSQLGDYANEISSSGYEVVHLPFAKSPVFFVRLFSFMRHGHFDVIHIHAERANFWTGLAARLTCSRVVRSVHNVFAFDGYLRIRRRFQRMLLERLGVSFVACSLQVAENEANRFGIHPFIVNNWFDPRRTTLTTEAGRAAARRQLGLTDDTFCIVSIGNYSQAKNQEAIVAAVRAFSKDAPIIYLHCGAGGDILRTSAGLTAADPVRLLGPMFEIKDLLLCSDAFISPSLNEGGPISLLEAGSAGTPCITTRVGLAQQFVDVPNVVFVETSPASIAAGIRDVASRPLATRLSDGERLARFVNSRFSPSSGGERYRAIYEGREPPQLEVVLDG